MAQQQEERRLVRVGHSSEGRVVLGVFPAQMQAITEFLGGAASPGVNGLKGLAYGDRWYNAKMAKVSAFEAFRVSGWGRDPSKAGYMWKYHPTAAEVQPLSLAKVGFEHAGATHWIETHLPWGFGPEKLPLPVVFGDPYLVQATNFQFPIERVKDLSVSALCFGRPRFDTAKNLLEALPPQPPLTASQQQRLAREEAAWEASCMQTFGDRPRDQWPLRLERSHRGGPGMSVQVVFELDSGKEVFLKSSVYWPAPSDYELDNPERCDWNLLHDMHLFALKCKEARGHALVAFFSRGLLFSNGVLVEGEVQNPSDFE